MDKIIETNIVNVSGIITSEFKFDHEVFGEKFYTSDIDIRRASGTIDRIKLMASERLLDPNTDYLWKAVRVSGRFKSYNKKTETGSRVFLHVFANELDLILIDQCYDENKIFLDGYICKKPSYRLTPLDREISDTVIAVNRTYGKTDYIPCIFWGRNAKYVHSLDVGTHIALQGRIQSREYIKKISETETETKTAYEVSVSNFQVIGGGEDD